MTILIQHVSLAQLIAKHAPITLCALHVQQIDILTQLRDVAVLTAPILMELFASLVPLNVYRVQVLQFALHVLELGYS